MQRQAEAEANRWPCRGQELVERLAPAAESDHETDSGQPQVVGARRGQQLVPKRRASLERALLAAAMPFLILFLVRPPSARWETHREQGSQEGIETRRPTEPELVTELLASLMRFSLGRFRLQSGLQLAEAKEIISSKSDLQEEEEQTHLMLVAPAEHRSYGPGAASGAYAAPEGPQQQHQHQHQHQQQGEPHGPLPADYGEGPATVIEHGGGGEGSVEGPAPVATGSSQLQTRADLPAVRALNVKCEKNHMTVS